ncbi:MAG: FAD binding domain-containing protein [Candidatus Protistobacter heckmanni]|nr:FAD binding domain-containing protein [Candidatus Protistobacter heckmanni]
MTPGNQQGEGRQAQLYLRPTSLAQALRSLDVQTIDILAGGMDYYAARVGRPIAAPMLDVSAVAEMRGIAAMDGGWRIGAGATWTDVAQADLPPLFDGLKDCALKVVGIQVQNWGTVGGNLCNASPASDGVLALISLGTRVTFDSAAGERIMLLEDIILGKRRTQRHPNELLTEIFIPARAPSFSSTATAAIW